MLSRSADSSLAVDIILDETLSWKPLYTSSGKLMIPLKKARNINRCCYNDDLYKNIFI